MNPNLHLHFRFTLITAALALILAGTPARIHAASSGQVVIDRTTIDYALKNITIVGTHFGPTTPNEQETFCPSTSIADPTVIQT
jgi:hypothetical protein